MQEYDAKALILSKDGILAEKIKERFEEKYIQADIEPNIPQNLTLINYLIINLIDTNFDLRAVLNLCKNNISKIIVLAPSRIKSELYDTFDTFLTDLLGVNTNLGVILVPEIIGDFVKFDESNLSHRLLMQSILSNRIKINNSAEEVQVITFDKISAEIVKETLSFGTNGKKLLITGYSGSVNNFLDKALNILPENIITITGDINFKVITPDITKNAAISLKSALSKSRQLFPKTLLPEKTNLKQKPKSKTRLIKYAKPIIGLGLVIFVTPLLLMCLSITFLLLSIKTMPHNRNLSANFIKTSSFFTAATGSFSLGIDFYSDYPDMAKKALEIFNELSAISEISRELINGINGDQIYDLQSYSDAISAGLDKIHTDISFLQSDIEGQKGLIGESIKSYLLTKNISIDEYKGKIFLLKKFTSRLPEILGMESPKKYIVLFQNNMELRPTGGFIGSFALMTLDKGRLTEMVVNDVYSADGQLKGHVDPPEPIRNYLNEGGWYLRDSNWDPDFVKTSSKIEWFLDKEIDITVDGVIAIDLYFIENLLKITGPIILPDFNKTIDSNNLYVTTQSEVQDEFFPGSIKKATFLVSLSKNLINELRNFCPCWLRFIIVWKKGMYKSFSMTRRLTMH